MKQFLKLCGVEELNGLSPFSVDMYIPDDLIKLIQTFLCTPKGDMIETTINNDATNQVYNGGNE